MQNKSEKIVVVGDSTIAEVAYEYFTYDSPYQVVAFTLDQQFIKRESLFGLPIVPFETVQDSYPPAEFKIFVAVGYGKLNRLRTRFYGQAKAKGYDLVSYISSKAFVWRNVEVGDNCFIFEHNVIQPFVKIGNNVTLWSGNHIGHHSVVKDHCFIASQVVISGAVEVGESCFIGVNATVANNVIISKNCFLGAGVIILKDTEENRVFASEMTAPKDVSSLKVFRISEINNAME